MAKSGIEAEWWTFLKAVSDGRRLPSIQQDEMRKAFYASCASTSRRVNEAMDRAVALEDDGEGAAILGEAMEALLSELQAFAAEQRALAKAMGIGTVKC